MPVIKRGADTSEGEWEHATSFFVVSEMEKMKIGRRFERKVVIVTASTQGIGFGIAERLGLEGASVVISSRKQVTHCLIRPLLPSISLFLLCWMIILNLIVEFFSVH